MGSVSLHDGLEQMSERFESYSLNADVSESESSSCSSSCRRYDIEPASTSLTPSSVVGQKISVYPSFPMPPLTISPPFMANMPDKRTTDTSEVELMKERFAKLLLGEDMSGGGKGVCTALAISNAITNLSAMVFGELWKLEPLAPQKKSMWYREMDWLLSVSNSIVELIPSLQEFPGGGTFEVMVTRPRLDLYVNLPALKKLDAMLLTMLDEFQSAEFYYIERGVIVSGTGTDGIEPNPLSSSSGRPSIRLEEKWWLPFPKVPPNGLSDDVRKRLQQCRECTNQIHKAAMAINSNVLSEMEIPNVYLDSLPKSGKACLGEIMYSYMPTDHFSPECLLDYLDLSSEYTTLEVANRIEAAMHIWRQKYLKKNLFHVKAGKSSWGGKVKGLVGDTDKNKLLAQRAETLLKNLMLRFPGLPQTALDTNKIQYNKDVGQSILESYSRVMESLAFNIMARVDDLLYVDDATKQRAAAAYSISTMFDLGGGIHDSLPLQKLIFPSSFSIQHTPYAAPPFTIPPAAYSANNPIMIQHTPYAAPPFTITPAAYSANNPTMGCSKKTHCSRKEIIQKEQLKFL